MIGEENETMSNKWYIGEMKNIILSCDGSEYYIICVPDNIANDLAVFINLFYKQRYDKMPVLEPFDPIEEFIDFVNCKVPEHPAQLVEIFISPADEDFPEKYRKYKHWNF